MASVAKYTSEAIVNMLRHNKRLVQNPSNPDICKKDDPRSKLNYSIPLDHDEKMTDYEYYKKLVKQNFLYGRGTAREKQAVTACSWVVTLPKELTGNPKQERVFFQAVFDFISHRYGKENIISNSIHYDEAGQPHMHILFAPVVPIVPEHLHFKTRKTTEPFVTETGRYEYKIVPTLKDGKPIPKKYTKAADQYNSKLAAKQLLNPLELSHFHSDLQNYLRKHGIAGSESVLNGSTANGNIKVDALKQITKTTGLTLGQINDLQVQVQKSHAYIEKLEQVLSQKNQIISAASQENAALQKYIAQIESAYKNVQAELSQATEKIEQLEKHQTIEKSQQTGWGTDHVWGEAPSTTWGKNTKIIEEEKQW